MTHTGQANFVLEVHVPDGEYDFKIYFHADTAKIWRDEASSLWFLEKNNNPDDRMIFFYVTELELKPYTET